MPHSKPAPTHNPRLSPTPVTGINLFGVDVGLGCSGVVVSPGGNTVSVGVGCVPVGVAVGGSVGDGVTPGGSVAVGVSEGVSVGVGGMSVGGADVAGGGVLVEGTASTHTRV